MAGRAKAKSKSGAPGSDATREAWEKAARGSGGNGAAKPKGGKRGDQLKIKVDSRDAVHIPAKHELHRKMTHTEWEEQSALLAANRVRLMTLEEEIAALKRKHAPELKTLKKSTAQGARQCDQREWLSMVDCIEVHDVNRRAVTVYADVGRGALGAEVVPERRMRDDEYERAAKTAPFEPPPLDPPTGPAIEATEEPAKGPATDEAPP